MNTENILKLADFIEDLPHLDYDTVLYIDRVGSVNEDSFKPGTPAFFNMRDYHASSHCGTAGCIAGSAVGLFGASHEDVRSSDIHEIAEAHLGLNTDDADVLFAPSGLRCYYRPLKVRMREITPQQAANALRYFAAGHSAISAWQKVGVV